MSLYVYKWMYHKNEIQAYGVNSEGGTQCVTFITENFILLEGGSQSIPLDGLRCLQGTSFIDEFGSGGVFSDLYLLRTNSAMDENALRVVGTNPTRYKFKRSFLTHADSLHKYFILKNYPYYCGWYATKPFLALPERKDRPPFTLLFFDIECIPASANKFPNELNAQDSIGSISFVKCQIQNDTFRIIQSTVLVVSHRSLTSLSTSEYDVISCNSEQELLRLAIVKFKDPSVHFLAGFNNAGFDDRYLLGRYYFYGLEKSIYKGTYPLREDSTCVLWYLPQHLNLDVFRFYKEYRRYASNSLDYLSREILKEETKKPMDYKHMRDIFININVAPLDEVAKIMEYNFYDSLITMKLCSQDKILDFILTISALCYLNVERVILAGKTELLTGYILIESYRNGYLINPPPKLEPSNISPYQGAIVFLGEPGVYDNVSVLDFHALYPSIITAKNISPSTCKEEPYPPYTNEDVSNYFSVKISDHRYCWTFKKTVQTGAFPFLCQRLLDARTSIKTQLEDAQLPSATIRYLSYLQLAIKIINNSIYGLFGARYSKFYTKLCAESITAHARETILIARDYFKTMDIKTIFLDTDSLFLESGSEVRGRELTQAVNTFIGVEQLVMNFECFFNKLFLYSKKKYYGLLGDTTKASGFELKKKDFPAHCKTLLQAILNLVLFDSQSLLLQLHTLTEGLFRFDLCYHYPRFSKIITTQPLYKYHKNCHAPHVEFIRRMALSNTSQLPDQFITLLKSPFPHHIKKGYALGLVDETNQILGYTDAIPLNLTHCVKGACTLFDKIYNIVFKDDNEVLKHVKDHFKQIQLTISKFNIVLFELKCVILSIQVNFTPSYTLVIPLRTKKEIRNAEEKVRKKEKRKQKATATGLVHSSPPSQTTFPAKVRSEKKSRTGPSASRSLEARQSRKRRPLPTITQFLKQRKIL